MKPPERCERKSADPRPGFSLTRHVDRLQLNYDDACAKFAEAARLDPDDSGYGLIWAISGPIGVRFGEW